VESRATTHGVRGAEPRTGLTGRKGCKAGGPGISSRAGGTGLTGHNRKSRSSAERPIALALTQSSQTSTKASGGCQSLGNIPANAHTCTASNADSGNALVFAAKNFSDGARTCFTIIAPGGVSLRGVPGAGWRVPRAAAATAWPAIAGCDRLSQNFLKSADASHEQSLFTTLFNKRFIACGHLILRVDLQSGSDCLLKPR
jgi:hypothetical protein